MDILKDLKKRREEKGLTQIDIAKYIGVSINTYAKWENGTSEPKEENMIKLIEVMEGENEDR